MFDRRGLEDTRNARERWSKDVLKAWEKKAPARKETFHTESGIPIKDVFTPEDIENMGYVSDLGFPGEYPYTRGAYPTMYRSRPWSVRQITGVGGASETNKRMREQFSQGVTRMGGILDCNIYAAYVDLDHPDFDRLYGLDSLGRTGYIATNIEDYEALYAGIPLDQVSISSMLGHYAQRETAMLFVLAKRRGIPLEKLDGISQNDSLQLFCGNYYPAFPPEYELMLTLDLVRFCADHVPKWNCLSMAGYNRQEAGLNAFQEVGVTIADAITYVREGINFGIDPERFVPRISFHWGFTMDFFEQVAKLRAARRIWAKITRDRLRLKDPSAWRMRFYLETSGSSLTAQQPYNNIIRVAIQALGGVLGGANAIHTASFDEALCAPTEFSAGLALRTQQIIEHETGLCDVVDPLAGSYYVEYLTNEIEREALRIIDEVEAMGGSLAAINNGYYFQMLQESAIEFQRKIESGEKTIVGVNQFQMEETQEAPVTKFSRSAVEKTLTELRRIRATRNREETEASLSHLQETVRDGCRGSMEATMRCCEAYCTLAEINRAAKEVCGTYELMGDAFFAKSVL